MELYWPAHICVALRDIQGLAVWDSPSPLCPSHCSVLEINCPALRYAFPLLDEQKIVALPALLKFREGILAAWTLLLFPICPSQWTQADGGLRGRLMEVVNAHWKQNEQWSGRGRCMAAHIALDTMTDERIMEQGYFPQ